MQVETIDIENRVMQGTDQDSGTLSLDEMSENLSLSDEDREEILKDIEKVVTDSRISVSTEMYSISPLKNGSVFPVLINLFAIASVAAVFFVSTFLFENTKADLNLESMSYMSAEGKLLEELKKDAAQALASKEQEISTIQDELFRLDLESRNLKETMEATISEREAALRNQLAAELEEERKRLLAQGRSSQDIERELSQLEAQRSQTISAELEAFKTQAAASIKEKEAELIRARQLTEDILRQANEEKVRIEEETQARQAALSAQFEEERQSLLAQSEDAFRKLSEISQQQETENLVTDQILAAYDRVISRMRAEEFPEALSAITSLRAILDDPKINTLPRIAKRIPIETFILDTLEQEIKLATSAEPETPSGLVEAAEQLFRARSFIALAEDASEKGNAVDAEKLYIRALDTVPELKKAVTSLRAIETDRRSLISRNILAEARQFENAGDMERALQGYAGAAAAFGPGETEQAGIRSAIDAYSKSMATFSETQTTESKTAMAEELAQKLEAERKDLAASYEQRLAAQEQGLLDDFSVKEAEFRSKEEEYLAKIQELEAALGTVDPEDGEALTAALENIAALETALENAQKEIESLTLALEEAPSTAAAGDTDTAVEITDTAEVSDTGAAEIPVLDEAAVMAYEQQIEELKAELEMQKAMQQGSSADISAQQAENTRLSSELETLTNRYENELAALSAERSALQEHADLLQKEKQQIQKDLDAAVLELVNFVTSRSGDERYTALALLYNGYQERLNELIASDKLPEATTLLTRFYREEAVEEAFPGLGGIHTRIEDYLAAREKETGIRLGRESALADVIRAAAYLEKDAATDFSKTPLDTPMATETRFREAVLRIQDLAADTLKRRVSSRSSSEVFIGSISNVSGDRFYVESLISGDIAPGTVLIIKRIASTGDMVIAKGTAVSQRGSRIEAKLTETTDTAPRTVDLVYTE